MNPAKCLEWCHEVRHRFPDDRRTAIHVIEWLAEKAEQDAVTVADVDAIDAALANAKRILGGRKC